MHTTYITVVLITAGLVGFSAGSVFAHASWVVDPLDKLRVPRSWRPWLATAKAAGAAGLLVGLFVPTIGVLAAICLVSYFAGAVIITIRERWYAHLPAPLLYAAPVLASLAFGIAAGWPHWTAVG
jgi:uncharacterized membrane protein YjjP (DUF1212 family)